MRRGGEGMHVILDYYSIRSGQVYQPGAENLAQLSLLRRLASKSKITGGHYAKCPWVRRISTLLEKRMATQLPNTSCAKETDHPKYTMHERLFARRVPPSRVDLAKSYHKAQEAWAAASASHPRSRTQENQACCVQ